jgi:hypothetical protein
VRVLRGTRVLGSTRCAELFASMAGLWCWQAEVVALVVVGLVVVGLRVCGVEA